MDRLSRDRGDPGDTSDPNHCDEGGAASTPGGQGGATPRAQATGACARVGPESATLGTDAVQRCGKVGHIANVCPSPVVCSRCHMEGQVARVCLTKMP